MPENTSANSSTPSGTGATNSEDIRNVMDALDRLLKMFMVERYVYLLFSILSFILLLFSIYQSINTKTADSDFYVAVFGGSGLIAVCSARISLFFNRAFSVLENLINKNTGSPQK